MLVLLDASLLHSLALNPTPHSAEAIAVDLAAEAARQGVHVLVGDVSTFDGLIARADVFSERTRSLLVRARSKTTFRTSLLTSTIWYVRLCTNVNAPATVQTATGQTEIMLPAATLAAKGTFLQAARFISENNNDGRFYEALAYELIAFDPTLRRLFSTIRFRFDLIQGGGNTTGAVYAHEKGLQNHFCLAVVDSDQTYENGPIGDTAQAVVNVDSAPNAPAWNARALVLKVRAVENLFPVTDLRRAARELDATLGDKADWIVDQHSGKPHWDYIFLKRGLRCFEISKADNNETKYLKNALGFGACPNHSPNPCTSKATCETFVLEPLGDQLLAQVCSVKPIRLTIDAIRDSTSLPHLHSLFREMISAFCGDAPPYSP